MALMIIELKWVSSFRYNIVYETEQAPYEHLVPAFINKINIVNDCDGAGFAGF